MLGLLVRLISHPLTGLLSQLANPAVHPVTAQAPALQALLAWAREHAFPHTPQLPGSEARLTQEPLQLVSPAWQESAHAPAEQTLPAAQILPQMPQLEGSLWVLVQVPLQIVSPI